MGEIIKSFGFAVKGIFDALILQRNFRVEWLLGLMVFLINNFLHLEIWQHTILLFLVFLVLSLELSNCAIEKTCDSTGKAFNSDKKNAKDFAAGSVLLCAIGSALVFFCVTVDKVDAIIESLQRNPASLILLLLILICSLPICLSMRPNKLLLYLFLLGVPLDAIYVYLQHDKPLFSILSSLFHIILLKIFIELNFFIKRRHDINEPGQ